VLERTSWLKYKKNSMPSSLSIPPDARNIGSAESYLYTIGRLLLYKASLIGLDQTLIRPGIIFQNFQEIKPKLPHVICENDNWEKATQKIGLLGMRWHTSIACIG
jgi:hypothetical protein